MPPSIYHRGWHRGIGDITHSQTGDVTEILLPGCGTGTFSRQLHITQSGDANTDWNIAAQANPTLYIHSTTTPITDYFSMNHDGDNTIMDTNGGNWAWQIGGTTYASLSATSFGMLAANLRLGPVNDFATTEPTQAAVFEAGTAPAGAITTSGAIFTDGTVMKKLIANGTVSNIET